MPGPDEVEHEHEAGCVGSELTGLLNLARGGDSVAAAQALSQTYQQLRRLAQRVRGGGDQTLSATALVHEAYFRLFGTAGAAVQDRAHFYNLAARAMRQILVDRARERQALKRGGSCNHAALSTTIGFQLPDEDVLALEQALERLDQYDPLLVRIVEGYFYAGFSFEDIAGMLGSSERSVRRQWALARAFLSDALGAPGSP